MTSIILITLLNRNPITYHNLIYHLLLIGRYSDIVTFLPHNISTYIYIYDFTLSRTISIGASC